METLVGTFNQEKALVGRGLLHDCKTSPINRLQHYSWTLHNWSHLARGELRQQLTEDVEVDAGDLEVLPQLGDLVLAQLAVVHHGAALAGDLLHQARVHLLGPALALANL